MNSMRYIQISLGTRELLKLNAALAQLDEQQLA
jgi:hypothetical protein